MRRPLRYSDAVKMLDGGESRLISFLDKASSGVLAGFEAFDLFEAKAEAVKLADRALKNLKVRLHGISALTRTERLVAAHWIVIITAFFEAVDERLKEVGIKDLGASASEQIVFITDMSAFGPFGTNRSVFRSIGAHGLIVDVEQLYQLRTQQLKRYLQGLAIYESLSTAECQRLDALLQTLPDTAVLRYEERLRSLATECPEFGIWLNVSAHSRTLDAVHEVHSGLARLEAFLASSPIMDWPHNIRRALSMAYQAVLDKPITQQAPPDLSVPSLATGYIDHRYRVAAGHPTANPAQEQWWSDRPTCDDLDLYLASYLVSDVALTAPMLVLGHPGSGKSVLTRVLAARLPADRFLPIRVELRNVDANADLQAQIEEAVRQTTGETIRWPELVRSAAEATPVVLLDGFDELLQATGVAQTDFLERVARFQEREIDQGRAVAVVVTSRIAVADRARIPADTVVMRLEPFDDRQIKAWLEVWADCNAPILAMRELWPLSADVALSHKALAEQPLMLLMLALYDASANALRSADEEFGQAELYEALLTDFARREVEKEQSGPADDDAVERELANLSVVAFAMFNRRAQWVTDEDVTRDLIALRMAAPVGGERSMKKSLTAGQLALGRFFFIHDTQATRDGGVSQTYEFLHATFGEFLIARFTARLITALAEARSRASAVLSTTLDDGRLHALLSFDCLAATTPVIDFLSRLVPRDQRLTDLLVELFSASFDERSDTTYAGYRPAPITAVQRHANWSVNLMLLATIAGDGITASRLFQHSEEPAAVWRDSMLLWRGQLSSSGRNGLIRVLSAEREGSYSAREIRIGVDPSGGHDAPIRLEWTYDLSDGRAVVSGHDSDWLHRKFSLGATKGGDVLLHGVEPIAAMLPQLAHTIVQLPGRPAMTTTHALLAAFAALAEPWNAAPAVEELLAVVTEALLHDSTSAEMEKFVSMAAALFVAAAEAGVVSGELSESIADLTRTVIFQNSRPAQLAWRRMGNRLGDDLAEDQPPTTPAPPGSEGSASPSP